MYKCYLNIIMPDKILLEHNSVKTKKKNLFKMHIPQLSSSEPSLQSYLRLHFRSILMHCPSLHLNSFV